MTARCIACNNFLFWDEKEIKKQPGFRPKCNCGGAADVMVSSGLLRGTAIRTILKRHSTAKAVQILISTPIKTTRVNASFITRTK
jgi:hypothetical protein